MFVDRPAGRSERMASQQEILARGAGDVGNSHPATGESGEGNGNTLHFCLENPMDRGAWRTTVHGVTRVRYNLVTKPTKPTGDSRREGKAENGKMTENNGQKEKKEEKERQDRKESNFTARFPSPLPQVAGGQHCAPTLQPQALRL